MDNKIIKILVATHKKYDMPSDAIYIPVSAGAIARTDNWSYVCDNHSNSIDGEISSKNPGYNEMTVLYWGWKNQDADYLGLVHYRRHLALKSGFGLANEHSIRLKNVLTEDQIRKLLAKYDLLFPKKRYYCIQSLKEHFLSANPHMKEQYDIFRNTIADLEPEYLPAFDQVMSRRSGHLFNIFVMRRDYADAYCEWLYNILFEAEKRITEKGLHDKRFYGLMSEYMLDTWNEIQKIEYCELPVLYIDKEDVKGKAIKFVKRFFRKNKKS